MKSEVNGHSEKDSLGRESGQEDEKAWRADLSPGQGVGCICLVSGCNIKTKDLTASFHFIGPGILL